MLRRRVVSAVVTLSFTFLAGCAVSASEAEERGDGSGKVPDEVDQGGAKPGDDMDAGVDDGGAVISDDGGPSPSDSSDGDGADGDGADGADGSDGSDDDMPVETDGDAGDGNPPDGTAQLPFAVDDHFVSSGYMGDATVDPASLTMTPLSANDDKTCAGDRSSPSATGHCHIVTYEPSTVQNAPGWAGVYWQAHLDDWGTMPGVSVESGAQRVVFYAKGKVGGEVITVGAGGLSDPAMPYKDTFAKERNITLTTAWARYEIDLTGLSYDEVLGGFKWSAAGAGASQISFQLDDIHWE